MTITTPRTQRPLIAGVLRRPPGNAAPITRDLCPRGGAAPARDGASSGASSGTWSGAPSSASSGARRGFSPPERDAVRAAAANAARDPRDAGQRTIDCVVDRLLRELTW